MISKPSANSKFTATFQGDAGTGGNWNAYTLSRSMLRIKREDVQQMSIVNINYTPEPNVTIAYYTDPSGVLEIPLQDFVNANTGGTLILNVAMTEMNGTSVDTLTVKVDIFEGISYYNVFAPRNKDAERFFAAYGHNVVMPPNVIINPTNANNIGIKVESNLHVINNAVTWAQRAGGVSSTITPAGARNNRIDVDDDADTLLCTDGVDTKDWPLMKPDYCTNLVVCRWTSRTGCVRQHWFPIAAFINGVDQSTSVVEAGNGYDIRKDTFDAVRCRLTGLTAYGYWYYMDIIRASDLHAIVMPTIALFETEISSMETAAYCEAQEMETPQGNGFYNFEFTLKLRHYDTH